MSIKLTDMQKMQLSMAYRRFKENKNINSFQEEISQLGIIQDISDQGDLNADKIEKYCSSVLADESFIQNLYGKVEKNDDHIEFEGFKPFSFLRALTKHEDAAVSAIGKKMTKLLDDYLSPFFLGSLSKSLDKLDANKKRLRDEISKLQDLGENPMQKRNELRDIQDKYEKQHKLYGKRQKQYKNLRSGLVSFTKYCSALWQITKNDVSVVAQQSMDGISWCIKKLKNLLELDKAQAQEVDNSLRGMPQLSPQQAAKDIGKEIKRGQRNQGSIIPKSRSTGDLVERIKGSRRVFTRQI